MNLLEYEGKKILQAFSIPTPRGKAISEHESPHIPCVLKSQVPVGGRGKAGGIVVVNDESSYHTAIKKIRNLSIDGFTPRTILREEVLSIVREFYMSITINRSYGYIELIAHRDGGVDIESRETEEFFRRHLSLEMIEGIGEVLADYYGMPEKCFTLQDILTNLYHCFVESDAILIEINPLCLTSDGKLVAGDCKMTLDDAATFRHKAWDFEHHSQDSNFVILDQKGTVASIANGAGLAMATVDAIAAHGLVPANFLDIGGAATTESILTSFKKITNLSHVDAIVINIFGGIVRCDDVAKAIIEARELLPELPNLTIRLSGNRSDEARELLASTGLTLHNTLASCLEEIHS